MNSKELLEHFNTVLPRMVGSIREIIDIESPSRDAEQSAKAVDWVENAVNELTLESVSLEKIKVDGIGTHLTIRCFHGGAPPLLILGHTDTVHPVGTRNLNPTRIEEDRLFGCGVFDMKANIVVAIEALRYFAENSIEPKRPITIFLSCDEEVGSHSGRAILEQEAVRSAACLVLEPSANGRVKTGRKGTGMYTLKAHGVPAHAGLEPEKGASAILEIARQIEKLYTMNDLSVGTTVNVCTASGGTTSNVIPENAECTVDVRFSTMSEAERLDGLIKALEPVDERVTLEISGGINRPPLERTRGVVELYEVARDIAASFNYDLAETQVGGASDGNFVGALGIPVLDGLGIAGDGAHTLHEYILVSDIVNRAALITSLLKNA